MGRLHENLRMENQLIVDLIYTLLVKVECACNTHLGFSSPASLCSCTSL